MFSLDSRTVFLAICGGVVAKVVHLIIRQYALLAKMPPGPKGLPLLGNVLQLSSKDQHLQFTQLASEYGPLVTMYLAGQPLVIVNSLDAAADLFLVNTEVHSDRPRLIMVNDIMAQGLFIAFTPYGDLWRKLRRAAHESFNIRAVERYQSLQENEASILVSRLLESKDDWMDHTKRSGASTILSIVYGWAPLDSTSDALVKRINGFMHRVLKESLPGARLVELFTFMRHFPAAISPWKQEGIRMHEEDTAMFMSFLEGVKEAMATDSSHMSFVASLLTDKDKFEISDKEAAWLAGTMFAVGSDTTAAATESFIVAMLLYPDVMRRAQAEIDAVVGRARLPTFADRPNLPYVDAVVREALRWRPVSALGMRRTMKDDYCKGYLIPEGTIIITNHWAMNQDPDVFGDPLVFRPERYLDKDDPLIAKVMHDTRGNGHWSFGQGRRGCIGMNVANQTLFMNIARLLWTTNIESGPPIDPNSPPLYHDEENTSLVRPKFARCSFKPRFDGAETFLKLDRVSSA